MIGRQGEEVKKLRMKIHPRKDGCAYIHGIQFLNDTDDLLANTSISLNGNWHEAHLGEGEKIIGVYGRYKDYWITSLGFIVYSLG